MHPGNQHIFIIRAVERSYITLGRGFLVAAPEKIVIQFLAYRFFEADGMEALRIQTGQHLFDHTVLAAAIHSLKNNQDTAGLAGKQLFLLLQQFVLQPVKFLHRRVLVFHTASIIGIEGG
ncbi:hypothetical protein D3C75_1168810 [compost metagenome]